MSSDDTEPFEVSVTMTRGTSTDDRDKIKATISADTLDELDEKMVEMRDRLEKLSADIRTIQPKDSTTSRQFWEGRAMTDSERPDGEVDQLGGSYLEIALRIWCDFWTKSLARMSVLIGLTIALIVACWVMLP